MLRPLTTTHYTSYEYWMLDVQSDCQGLMCMCVPYIRQKEENEGGWRGGRVVMSMCMR